MEKVYSVLSKSILPLTQKERDQESSVSAIICKKCNQRVLVQNNCGFGGSRAFDYIATHHTDAVCDRTCPSSGKFLSMIEE